MKDEIDSMVLAMLEAAAPRDLSENDLKLLERKVEIYIKVKSA